MQFTARNRNMRRKNKRTRRAPNRANLLSRAITRRPPLTTTIVVPGSVANQFDSQNNGDRFAFNLNTNTFINSSEYNDLRTIYQYYRLKKVTMQMSIVNATTNTAYTYCSTLQYVGTFNNSAVPDSVVPQFFAMQGLSPSKVRKAWQPVSWTWTVSNPFDLVFRQFSSPVTVGILMASVTPSPPQGTVLVVNLLYKAHFEFYGSNAAFQPSLRQPANTQDADEDGDYGFAQLH